MRSYGLEVFQMCQKVVILREIQKKGAKECHSDLKEIEREFADSRESFGIESA